MAAVLKIYFSLLLLNRKANWHQTCSEASGWLVDQKKLKSFQSEIQDGRQDSHLESLFFCFSWTERPVDSKLARKHRGNLFKQSSWILLKMFVLMISRSSSKLCHLGSKTRSSGQISGKTFNPLVVTFFKQSLWILLNMYVLMISRSKMEHMESKTRSPGQISGKPC